MIHTLWEFQVRADRLPEFERVHSGAGPWAQLFAKNPGFRGTALLRDPDDPRHFLTIDSWDSLEAQAAIQEQFRQEYADLDRACEDLTETERHVGVFVDWRSPDFPESLLLFGRQAE